MIHIKKIITVMAAVATMSGASAFNNTTPLSSGNWVKVNVTTSGIYEISYAQLREMGFGNPSAVGVYGRGGAQMSMNFYDANHKYLGKDELTPVAVYHSGDKIYFYGEGVEDISFTKDYTEFGGQFDRKSLNIYSREGCYLLTEDASTERMQDLSNSGAGGSAMPVGYGYVYHEQDLEQNNSGTGQLFWGERFNNGNPTTRVWSVNFPSITSEGKAKMKCVFYAERSTSGQLSFGVEGATGNANNPIKNFTSSSFEHQTPDNTVISLPSSTGVAYVTYEGEDNPAGDANLDYWIISYQKNFPTLEWGESQERVFYPRLQSGNTGAFSTSGVSGNTVVFDVTDRQKPVIVGRSSGSSLSGSVTGHTGGTDLIVSDLSKPQLQVTVAGRIENSNLHALDKGAELLIITVPSLREAADRIADLHRKYDGIRVAVAETPAIFNEYSAGVPDAMAYRGLVKHLHDEGSLKNVLLLGPIQSDFRGMTAVRDPYENLIAFQNPVINFQKGSNNVNDFYGITGDVINTEAMEKEEITVGVGILPCYNMVEASLVADKIERFLTDPATSEYLNETLTIGGLGDSHTHDEQAIYIGNLVHSLDGGTGVQSTLCVDAFGNSASLTRFVDYINRGKMAGIYLGHGRLSGFGGKGANLFVTKGDIDKLNNDHLGFMMFAGCDLSHTDKGVRGIGESFVMDTKNGMVGVLLATRESWSGQNLDFAQRLFSAFYVINDSKRSVTPTIGEVVAHAKSTSVYSNALTYQLICDPALRLPLPLGTVNVDNATDLKTAPGSILKITGTVTDAFGKSLTNFNGDFTIKLMEPEVTLRSQDIETGNTNDGVTIDIRYDDNMVSSCGGKVVNGKIDGMMIAPNSIADFVGKEMVVYVSAYDANKKLGVSQRVKVSVVAAGSAGLESDTELPVIGNMEYDFEAARLSVAVSDNIQVNPASSSLKVTVNGKQYTGAKADVETLVTDRSYICRFPIVLPEGKNEVRVWLSDRAGNVAEKSVTLDVKAPQPTIGISLNEILVKDKATFKFTGVPAESRLIITDSKGDVVYMADIEKSTLEWDRSTLKGDIAPAGLYKAFVRSYSSGANLHSVKIDVPLAD